MKINWIRPKGNFVLIEVNTIGLAPKVWNDAKITSLKQIFVNGAELEAPSIALRSNDSLMFVNGIHRTALAIANGFQTIKIAVDKEEAGRIKYLCNQKASF